MGDASSIVGKWILIIIFWGVIVWLSFSASATAGFNWFAWIPPVLAFSIIFLRDFGDWWTAVRVPTYLSEDGTYGKIISREEISGGRIRYKVAIRNQLVPSNVKATGDAWKRFEASLSGVTIINVDDFPHNFFWINEKYRNPPEEVLRHLNSITGQKIPNPYEQLRIELDYMNHALTKLNTTYMASKSLSESEAKENLNKLLEVFSKAKLIVETYKQMPVPQFYPFAPPPQSGGV